MASVSPSSADPDDYGSDQQDVEPIRRRGRYVSIAKGEISIRLVSTPATRVHDDDPTTVRRSRRNSIKRLDMAGEVVAAVDDSDSNDCDSPSSLSCELGNNIMKGMHLQPSEDNDEGKVKTGENDQVRRRHHWSTVETAGEPMSTLREGRTHNSLVRLDNDDIDDVSSEPNFGVAHERLERPYSEPPDTIRQQELLEEATKLNLTKIALGYKSSSSQQLQDRENSAWNNSKKDIRDEENQEGDTFQGSLKGPSTHSSRENLTSRHVSMTGDVILRVGSTKQLPTDGLVEHQLDTDDSQSLRTFQTASSTTLTQSLQSDLQPPFYNEDDEEKLLLFRSDYSQDSSSDTYDSSKDPTVSKWLSISKEIEDATTDGSLSTNNGAIVFHRSKRRKQSPREKRATSLYEMDAGRDEDYDEPVVMQLSEEAYDDENPEPTFRTFGDSVPQVERKRPSYLDIMIEDEGTMCDEDLSYRTQDDEELAVPRPQKRSSSFFRRTPEQKRKGSALLRVTKWNESDKDLEEALSSDTDERDNSENSGGSEHNKPPSLSEFLERNSPNNNSTSSKPVKEFDDFTIETLEDLSRFAKICRFGRWLFRRNEMACMVVIVILLAKAFPPLGAEYVQPDITSSWVCVTFIFVLAGLGLKTEQFSKAFQRLPFNLFVQCWSFCIDSSYIYGVSRGLVSIGILDPRLADGMVICACLPMTISSVTVMTKASNGDEAAAVFNCALGNVLGVFVSPVLIYAYVGSNGELDLADVLFKLAMRVVLPVIVGQCIQKQSKRAVEFMTENKRTVLKVQMYTLLFIVYTVFCRTFASGGTAKISDIFIMILVLFILFCCLAVISWACLKLFFARQPKLQVMGLFGCLQKTVAMGVPLITTIYDKDPNIGPYTLPLLIWYPMQLLICSFLIPPLRAFVKSRNQKLGIEPEEDYKGDMDFDDGSFSFHLSEIFSSASSVVSSSDFGSQTSRSENRSKSTEP